MLPQPYESAQLAKASTNSELAIGQKLPAGNATPLEAQLSQVAYQPGYHAAYQARTRAGCWSAAGSHADLQQ